MSIGKDAAEQKEASREQAAEGEALVAYLQGQRCLEDMLEELSESASVAQVGAAQLAELMMYPVDRFLRADLDGAVLFYSYGYMVSNNLFCFSNELYFKIDTSIGIPFP